MASQKKTKNNISGTVLSDNEYDRQAENFAKKYNVKLKVVGEPVYKKYFSGDTQSRWVYKMKLSRGSKNYTFTFGQSIAAGKKVPSLYSVLAALTKYDPGTIKDFCSDYGYEEYEYDDYGRYKKNKTTEKIYKAVVKEYNAVENLFGDIIDELSEIA